MRFANEMQNIARDLEAQYGYCVIQCVYNLNKIETDQSAIDNIVSAHWKKIDISDAIYVVNIGGYIGQSTQNEIDYATKLGKEVIYHE